MSLPRKVATVYVKHADASLARHRRSPEGTCDWCAVVWGTVVRYPCFPAKFAVAVRKVYGGPG